MKNIFIEPVGSAHARLARAPLGSQANVRASFSSAHYCNANQIERDKSLVLHSSFKNRASQTNPLLLRTTLNFQTSDTSTGKPRQVNGKFSKVEKRPENTMSMDRLLPVAASHQQQVDENELLGRARACERWRQVVCVRCGNWRIRERRNHTNTESIFLDNQTDENTTESEANPMDTLWRSQTSPKSPSSLSFREENLPSKISAVKGYSLGISGRQLEREEGEEVRKRNQLRRARRQMKSVNSKLVLSLSGQCIVLLYLIIISFAGLQASSNGAPPRQQSSSSSIIYQKMPTMKTKISNDNHHNQLASIEQPQPQQQQQQQCHTLTNLWQYLKTQYPALATQLLHWADRRPDVESASLAPTAPASTLKQQQQLGRLLEEADRQLQQQQQTETPQPGRQLAAWLSRVNSNPNYARLIAHLRAKQLEQQQQQQQSGGSGGQHVSYGRVAYYPHELTGSGGRQHQSMSDDESDTHQGLGGLQSAHTLDKLHLLNELTRIRQQQLAAAQEAALQSNQIERAPVGAPLPASVVPALAAQIEQMTAKDWRKSSESADEARNKFVYGEVLLRPNPGHTRPDHSDGQQAQTYGEQHGGGQPAVAATNELASSNQRPGQQQAVDLSYGRIITSPPSAGFLGGAEDQRYNEVMTSGGHLRAGSSAARGDLVVQPSGYVGGGLSGGDDNSNELVGQQRAHQLAMEGNAELLQQQHSPEEGEFEGHFHTGPLNAIEVRQLRSSDEGNNHRQHSSEEQLPVKRDEKTNNSEEQAQSAHNVFIVD